jgi:hypothetical protein
VFDDSMGRHDGWFLVTLQICAEVSELSRSIQEQDACKHPAGYRFISPCLMFCLFGQCIHCQFITAYSLPIYCRFTTYSLPIHYLFTVYSLPIHCLYNPMHSFALRRNPSHSSPLDCSTWCFKCAIEKALRFEQPARYQQSPISFHLSDVFLGLHVKYLASYIAPLPQQFPSISTH